MVIQFPLFFFGGGGGGEGGGGTAGLRVNKMHYGLCENGELSIFAAHSALQIISLFCGICQYGLGSFCIEKNTYFPFCGDYCCLHQRSTSTINTIILGLHRVVFHDGSNWLITMRGEVGLQKESLQISDYQKWYLSDRFHGYSSVKGAYRKLTLKESLNRVPRVLSYPFLRHSVGTGKRKPWERGWESPFSRLLILRLSTPVLKGIKGVGVKTS